MAQKSFGLFFFVCRWRKPSDPSDPRFNQTQFTYFKSNRILKTTILKMKLCIMDCCLVMKFMSVLLDSTNSLSFYSSIPYLQDQYDMILGETSVFLSPSQGSLAH